MPAKGSLGVGHGAAGPAAWWEADAEAEVQALPVPAPPQLLGQAEAQQQSLKPRTKVAATEAQVAAVAAALAPARELALSCACQPDGSLAAITLYAPPGSAAGGASGEVHVFPLAGMAPAARQAAVQHLGHLLQSPDVLKVRWAHPRGIPALQGCHWVYGLWFGKHVGRALPLPWPGLPWGCPQVRHPRPVPAGGWPPPACQPRCLLPPSLRRWCMTAGPPARRCSMSMAFSWALYGTPRQARAC